MKIAGLQKLTLLDFPERVACTVFLGGCNFRCPFCHNSALVYPQETEGMAEEEFFAFLKKRFGILDGVAITGGEPLLTEEIVPFIEKIKALGYAVKLDTNGSHPARLETLVRRGLVDYVAMDIKNSPEKYALTCGLKAMDLDKIRQSVRFLKQGLVPYEFRTTVVEEFHEAADFEAIGRWLEGAQAYYLQCFVDSGACLCEGLQAPSEEALQLYRALAAKYVPNTRLRGV
ncbi:MAG: anaerobic ribonucleoside-triphosphate reductase activating protein [Oscillospiraceae bacterium]|nr:anaerobic ribonucleoside-triphosphate reductase activating protein [Oscillospiraceae bacterium]